MGKPGDCQKEPIVLIGHSFGGKTAVDTAKKLVAAGYKVAFLVTLDPVINAVKQVAELKVVEGTRPDGVTLMWNWYQDVDSKTLVGASFPKADRNVKNAMGNVTHNGQVQKAVLLHTEIDDDPVISKEVKDQIAKINKQYGIG